MRLDHLLSKENRVFVLSPGWVLVSIPLVASFLSPHVGFACGGKVFQARQVPHAFHVCGFGS